MPGRQLNLDDHQPDPIELIFRGARYEIPGEIPLPAIVRMLRIKTRMEEAGGDIDALATELEGLIESGDDTRPGIMELIRLRQPDAPTLPLGVRDVVAIIEFLVASFDVEDGLMPGEAEESDPDAERDEAPVPLAPASSPSA